MPSLGQQFWPELPMLMLILLILALQRCQGTVGKEEEKDSLCVLGPCPKTSPKQWYNTCQIKGYKGLDKQ